ncbi:MAG TPA: Rnf-Nqr domain containing protein [Gammaproteobacteria bacterium]|nr:Rnf-Nqr domain containing protein [Gammaproteobacteria bacterium]
MKTASLQDQTIVALSICPLLIPVTGIVAGIAMGMIFALSLCLTGAAVYLLRGMIPPEHRIFMIALIAATIVAVIHMSAMALCYEFSLLLGIYLPLIAMNCVLFINNEEVVLRRSFRVAFGETVKTCVIMIFLLAAIGLLREVIGAGVLFRDAGLLFGEAAGTRAVRLVDERFTWEILNTAPGAFIVAGLIFALFNPGERLAKIRRRA